MVADQAEDSELAAKINRLFEIMRKPTESPLSNAAAAEAITAKTGVSISSAYLWQLRSGMKTNPTIAHLRAIATYFGVPASYLIDDGTDPNVDAQLRLLQTLRDAGVRDIAARASGLTPQSLESIRIMVDQARRVEQLPPVDRVDDES
ncbi:XRE family transcriptional regulator [Mycolicibacterium conceptionense]|nr:XRE family transcriptional regulator [Mycolicibacterium conceptionense]